MDRIRNDRYAKQTNKNQAGLANMAQRMNSLSNTVNANYESGGTRYERLRDLWN